MKKIAMLISAVVLFSGCTDFMNTGAGTELEPVVKGTYGVGINRVWAYDTEMRPDESTSINIRLTNIGNKTTNSVKLRLINYGELQLDCTDCDYYDAGILEPKEELEHSWTIKAPDTEGLDFYPMVKICYDYSSIGYKSVKVIDNAVYNPKSVILPSQEASTKGPMSVDFEIDNPLIIAEGGDSESFQVLFTNVDAGHVASLEDDKFGLVNYINTSDITLVIPKLGGRIDIKDGVSATEGKLGWTCPASESTETEWVCTNNGVAKLIAGKTLRIIMEGIPVSAMGSTSLDDMAFFEAEIRYQYCLTSEHITIKVR
jgi:hypothetical protein